MHKIKGIFEYITHVREKSRIVNKSGLYICFTFISIYALIMSLVCFTKANVALGIANIIIAVFMILTMLLFTQIKAPKVLAWSVVLFFYAIMMFFMYQGGAGGVSIMWLLFVPMAGMALINLYYGGILSLLLGICIPLYMLTPLHGLGYQYSEDYRIRFPIIYWAFTIVALVVFVRIDRYEETQKQMIKNADSANQMKSVFLANMAHEIRTPMNAIMGLCELNMNENISPIVRENNINISRSGKNLINIINDLLDFSKIESGRMELQCKEYRLSDLLNDVIYMTVARMGNKKLEFVVDCDPDVPNLLYGDEVRIKQIIINLLTNAVKYTRKGGFLLAVSCRKESYGINLIISVKDSGIGIKEECLGEIFAAYGRVDADKNHAIEGTGLGLPLTKKLIRLMNGVIRVDSEYGKGSEFKIIIPQTVVDFAPIVNIGNHENHRVLYCSTGEIPEYFVNNYSSSFKKVFTKMNAKGRICRSTDELKQQLSEERYTHIIIGRDEYIEDREYFDELSKAYCLAVVQERKEAVSVSENIRSIYKPFYTRNFSDFINSEREDKGQEEDVFTAPKAEVLVVDDNMTNIKVVSGLLKPYKVQLMTATSGAEAVEMVKSRRYDLIFMDHLMPGMSGLEAFRLIRAIENDYAREIPVIAMTANTEDEVGGMFAEEGFSGFVSKPVQSEILKGTLLSCLDEKLIIRNGVKSDE